MQALITSDKERFPELIHKISSSNSSAANIFINRELENLSKSIAIRRLSYTIYCGEKNRYLTQLPAIQEKVVELLRANVSDLVHSEVCSTIHLSHELHAETQTNEHVLFLGLPLLESSAMQDWQPTSVKLLAYHPHGAGE